MARSKTYKFIQKRKGKSLFFNLEIDPLEMNNLYDDVNFENEIKLHRQAIINWQGTDSLFGENYLDEYAPIINQPNATKYKDGHRAEIIEYFERKMKEEESGHK